MRYLHFIPVGNSSRTNPTQQTNDLFQLASESVAMWWVQQCGGLCLNDHSFGINRTPATKNIHHSCSIPFQDGLISFSKKSMLETAGPVILQGGPRAVNHNYRCRTVLTPGECRTDHIITACDLLCGYTSLIYY
jgi:hypothetical protein